MNEFKDMAPVNGRIIAFALICSAAFVLLVFLANTSDGDSLDRSLLMMLQTKGDLVTPRGPAWIREAARDLTALGSTSVLALITILALGAALLDGHSRLAITGLLVIVGGTVLSFLLKLGFDHPRPDLVVSTPEVFTSSFPSSHAMMSLVTCFTLAFILGNVGIERPLRRWLYAGAGLTSLIVGISRTYLGLHWPSDVAAGWLAGLVWLCAALLLIRIFESKDRP